MSLRKKVWITFTGIIILIGISAFVDYPNSPDIKFGNEIKEIKVHLGLDLQGGTRLVYDADTSQIPDQDKASALDGVRDVIERRINAFGVSEPLIQTNQSGQQWRVIVELAGVKDVNQAIKMIGETPLLEFKELQSGSYTDEEISVINKSNEEKKTSAQDVLKKALTTGEDFASLANEYSEDTGNTNPETGEKKGGDLGFFTKDQMVPEFSEVVFSKLKDGEIYPELVQTQYGYHIIKRTGSDGEQARASHILFLTQSTTKPEDFVSTNLSGKQLKRAAVEFEQNTNAPQVALEFDSEGKDLFAQITERNVGKIVGIYLDGSPISMPTVNEAIREGRAVISGDFTLDEAKTLAQRLNAGALPVPINLVSQQTIGATLGQLSIEKSLLAGIIGLVLVTIFMLSFYRLPGLIAILALIAYSLIILALFKLIPITMTLAGIAGYILSIGMAVDANILIFERTKEELRLGKTLTNSIEEGFNRAWLSIRDSNISSIITCIILAWLGTSIVKGFAITLGIGVVISMFSAITISRTFLRLIAGKWLEKKLYLIGDVSKKAINKNV